MGLILAGLILMVMGLPMIFARDFLWEWTVIGNQLEGQASERTEVWDIGNILGGVVITGVGLSLSLWGTWIVLQPVVPSACSYFTESNFVASGAPNYDRYMKEGCAAAQKKDYKTALDNFRRASTELETQRSKVDINLIYQYHKDADNAIEQIEKQLR